MPSATKFLLLATAFGALEAAAMGLRQSASALTRAGNAVCDNITCPAVTECPKPFKLSKNVPADVFEALNASNKGARGNTDAPAVSSGDAVELCCPVCFDVDNRIPYEPPSGLAPEDNPYYVKPNELAITETKTCKTTTFCAKPMCKMTPKTLGAAFCLEEDWIINDPDQCCPICSESGCEKVRGGAGVQ